MRPQDGVVRCPRLLRRTGLSAEETNVTLTEQILRHLESLPDSLQAEVLDFAEYLKAKVRAGQRGQEDVDWSALSLSQAMRGMESEATPYSAGDLKEIFS